VLKIDTLMLNYITVDCI